jgi:outer membrane protein assembly factor BamB
VSSPSGSATGTAPATSNATPFVRSDTQWLTYMGDPARSGTGPANPTVGSPHRTWTAQVDGDVYAEPLVTGGVVIAATEHDTVYALDAATGAVRWKNHLGEPVPLADLYCGNIDPNGITSTPVLDPAAGLVYTVALLNSPVRHELFALRLSDGSIAWRRSADLPGTDPHLEQQRGSLNLVNGRVYFSYGAFAGDCGPYHGIAVAASTDGGGRLDAWQVPSNSGGIWAPPGPVISAAGDVWVSTGNTGTLSEAEKYDDANAVIRLDAGLSKAVDLWAPKNWVQLNNGDTDLGSLAPALLPGGIVFVAGKEGVAYLLREGHLGGIGGEVFKDTVCERRGAGSTGAYGGAAVTPGMVFVPCKDGLAALRIDASAPSFSVAWRAALGANSPVLAYGLVWTVAADPNGYRQVWNGTLVGLDPASGAEKARVTLGPIPHYASPAAAGGNLYVAGLGSLYAVSAT